MVVTSTETTAPTGGGLRVDHPADGVRTLVFDHQESRIALDIELLTRLSHELALIRNDSAVRALILTGANGAFSAGADFGALEHLSQQSEAEVAESLARLMRVVDLLWGLPQPT